MTPITPSHMASQPLTIRDMKEAASHRRCRHPGCSKTQFQVGPFCVNHASRARRYGHPAAMPINRRHFDLERTQVRALLRDNIDHPGTKHALGFVSDFMAQAAAVDDETPSAPWPGGREVRRVIRSGARPLDVLVELAALALYLQRHPFALPDDQSRDFAASRAVFQLAPRSKRYVRDSAGAWPVNPKPGYRCKFAYQEPLRSALAYVGKALREPLAPFIANVCTTVEQYPDRRKKVEEDMRLPFL